MIFCRALVLSLTAFAGSVFADEWNHGGQEGLVYFKDLEIQGAPVAK